MTRAIGLYTYYSWSEGMKKESSCSPISVRGLTLRKLEDYLPVAVVQIQAIVSTIRIPLVPQAITLIGLELR